MSDCLIVGFNDLEFASHEARVRHMGASSGAYKDLALSFVRHDGHPLRALETINQFHPGRNLHNADFLWPVILVLGTSLHRRGHSFDYVNLPHLERDLFRSKLAAPDLKLVALTSTLYTEPQPLTDLVSFVRTHNPRVPIVIGGPYIAGQARALSEEALDEQLRYLGADFYVISAEGERALGDLVTALKEDTAPDEIKNLAFRRGHDLVFTARDTEYNVLAENMVDYSLFAPDAYGRFVTTRTAKSCPFHCSFCGFPERAGDYTYLKVEDVEKEFDAIASIGSVSTLTIIDDTFNVPKNRFKELLRMMIRRKYNFRWNSFFRCDHADEETIDLMAEANCEGVILGVESGSDRVLQLMNKTVRREQYLKMIPRLESCGIACYASLIVGFPGETRETIDETIDLIETTRPSYFRSQLWYCDPITPIYNKREQHGLVGEGFQWAHNTMHVQEACDHIDRMFLCVNNSIWQPQAGFEFWSTFYLQRQGMSRAHVNAFLRSFNTGVKEKLLRPSSSYSLSEARARDLARVSNINCETDFCSEPSEVSGAAYCAAENYWLKIAQALIAERATEVTGVPEKTLTSVDVGDGEATSDELIAALAMVVAAHHDRRLVLLLVQDGTERELLPLAVQVEPDAALNDGLSQVAAARREARRHRQFGLPILRRGLRVHLSGNTPRFGAAFVESEDTWQRTMADYPGLQDEIDLVIRTNRDRQLSLTTLRGPAAALRLAGALGSILWEQRGAVFTELTKDTEPNFDFR